MFKGNNENTRTSLHPENPCSKLTIKKHNDVILVSLLLTLTRFHTLLSFFIDFEQLNARGNNRTWSNCHNKVPDAFMTKWEIFIQCKLAWKVQRSVCERLTWNAVTCPLLPYGSGTCIAWKTIAVQTLRWVVTGICDPSISWTRHHCSFKTGSKLEYLNLERHACIANQLSVTLSWYQSEIISITIETLEQGVKFVQS